MKKVLTIALLAVGMAQLSWKKHAPTVDFMSPDILNNPVGFAAKGEQ